MVLFSARHRQTNMSDGEHRDIESHRTRDFAAHALLHISL